ncbi:MAG: PEP-CTERM sorting domain-containing protein [bacterium]
MPQKTITIIVIAFISLLAVQVSCSFAAALIDISDPTNPAIYTGIMSPADGSIWRVIADTPTGTGVYQPFLRYQDIGEETGLNTDLKPPPFDDKMPADQYTRSVLFSELDIVDFGGSDYFTFTIDFNEPGASTRFLSFDNFDLYQGSTPDAGAGDSLAGLTLMYDSNTTVLTDYTLASSGSGNDDIEFLIPVFTWTEPYMYLFITSGGYVGGAHDWAANDGFEEIRTTGIPEPPEPPVPEPSTLILLGLGLAGLAGLGIKKYKG